MSEILNFFRRSKRTAAAATGGAAAPAGTGKSDKRNGSCGSGGSEGEGASEAEEDKCPVHFNELQYLEEGGHKDIVRNLICVDVMDGRKRYLISSSDDSRICVWDVQSGQLVHALLGHTRPVTCMLVLDNRPSRTARSGDPGKVGVHNSLLLISGSSDKTIKVWDILRGVLVQDLKEHSGAVKALLAVDCSLGTYQQQQQQQYGYGGTPQNLLSEMYGGQQQQQQHHHNHHQDSGSRNGPRKFRISPSVFCAKQFCSGANDKHICIWDITEFGIVLSGKIPQYEDENLNCMLVLNSKHLITSSPSNSVIAAYSLKSRQFSKLLSCHREPPQCLVRLSSQHFVSGSLDGMVVMWNSDTLMSLRVFSNPEFYMSKDKVYVYKVSCIVPLGTKYIAAAIGNGFSVFDIHTGDLVLRCPLAHTGLVTCIIPLCNGACLLTSSDDSEIKLWLVPPHLNFRTDSPMTQSMTSQQSNSSAGSLHSSFSELPPVDLSAKAAAGGFGKDGRDVEKPKLAAELWGHSGAVSEIVKMSEYSFASCSSDTSVILWKDGKRQSELRNVYAALSMAHYNK